MVFSLLLLMLCIMFDTVAGLSSQFSQFDSLGRIVLARSSFNGNFNDFAVVRYTTAGTPDPTFNFGGSQIGVVTTSISANDDVAYSLAIDSANNIVVAGFAFNGVNREIALARYTSSGSLDTTFNVNGTLPGTLITPSNNDVTIQVLLIDTVGRYLLAGSTYIEAVNNIILARYLPAGTLDVTFGSSGIVTTAVINTDVVIQASTFDSSQNVLVAGYGKKADAVGQETLQQQILLARYLPTGVLDQTFGGNPQIGITLTPLTAADIAATSVITDTTGNIYVAGVATTISSDGNLQRQLFVSRYFSNGVLDLSFNASGSTPGIALILLGDLEDFLQTSASLRLDSAGRIVLVGFTESFVINGVNSIPTNNFVLARLTTAGIFDTNFNNGQPIITAVSAVLDQTATARTIPVDITSGIQIDSAGLITITGFANNTTSNNDFFAARYLANGTLDTTNFNPSGIQPGVVVTNTFQSDAFLTELLTN